ncbi:putative RNA-directed DNA polymerase from transposon X-element [Trichonephila clavipes]|nr:putative RNA-directed DNA polymerase from transposon X-element [Trichonephila clavipes]
MLNVSIIPPCDEEFITSLRNIMRHLNPVATSTHGHSAHFVYPALSSCTHVFLRIDKVSPPLTQPYTGPHEVIARTDKTLQIINIKPSWDSIDRVKPAFVSQDFDFPRAPKINTALKDITTSPKTVSEGQKQFSSSSKCLPSTTSTRTRSGRQSILFNIFINDLPDLLASDGLTNTALFADDLAIWCSTPKRDQSKLNTILNLTLERLHLWCIENNMTVNLKKTTCQFFTLNRQPFSPQLVYSGMPVQQNIQYKVINDVPFELLSFANPLDYAILDIRLDLVMNVRKRDLSRTALHAIALETINTRFPPEEWLHIYTDGSLLDFAQGAGIGVFSHLFFYLHAGPLTTHFDGEVEAIHIALQQLAVCLPPLKEL